MRIAWRTVGSIITRVVADAEAETDRFANLRRIGIDEISYKRGHKYLTVIVDHDSGVLLWAHPGRDQKTLEKFFDKLGEQRCARISLVSADAAEWIANVVADRTPTPSCAWTRSISWPGRPRPSTRSAVRCGTRPAGAGRRPSPTS